MSGGSWDYFYNKLEEVADRLLNEREPERRALGRALRTFSPALHAIEWVDSCDWSKPYDTDAIRVALGEHAAARILHETIAQSIEVSERLKEEIKRAQEVFLKLHQR
jgi:hypothetical protein